jgi:hypothetical protein
MSLALFQAAGKFRLDATRLIVSSPITTTTATTTTATLPTFAVTSYSFSPNPVTLGGTVNANISITSGTAGTYTLNIWRDIPLWPDALVTSYSISHNGATTSKTCSFTPTIAAAYHMELVYNGATLWSQPIDARRLTVSTPAPNVKIENVDLPSEVTVEQNYN